MGRAVSANIHKCTVVGLRALSLAALAVAMLLSWSFGAAHHARADQPHPGLQFHIGVDTNGDNVDDCSTVGDAKGFCSVPVGNTFVVNAYLDSIDGLVNYDGFEVWEDYTGVTSKGLSHSDVKHWPDCVFPVLKDPPGHTIVACAIGQGQHSTYTGKIATATYTCAADGAITLHHGIDFTGLFDSNGIDSHAENGPDVLNIRCFGPSLGGVADYPNISSGQNGGLLASTAVVLAVLTLVAGLIWRRKSLTADD